METCANPGCDQPGTNLCSACKSIPYCGPVCQRADWTHHKEECPGHLRKVGMTNLLKAEAFCRQNNYVQALHHANLSVTKFKQIKERPIEDIHEALKRKFSALNLMNRNGEALECAKEWYCLYPTNHTHPPAIEASFFLIESCIQNKLYNDAVLYAHTTWETITLSRDSHIPDNKLQWFTAQGARHLAKAQFNLAQSGGIPENEQESVGIETIALSRRALEIDTQLNEANSDGAKDVAQDMLLLASVLTHFKDVGDDEIPNLIMQAKAIFLQIFSSSSRNVAACENNLGAIYYKRAIRAQVENDQERNITNLELALSHFREAAQNYRAANHFDHADQAAILVAQVENALQNATTRASITATSRG